MSDKGKRNEWAHKLPESEVGVQPSWYQILIKNIALRFLMCDATTSLPQTSKFPRAQGTDGKIYNQVSTEL